MLQRRAKKAGITTAICNHSWRATGAIEMAQYKAGHVDPRTTKLYDRRRQQATRGEVEVRAETWQAIGPRRAGTRGAPETPYAGHVG
jgi:hypothetical protein